MLPLFISYCISCSKWNFHYTPLLVLLLVSDLLHFAPKLALDADNASSLFDRLDSDNDGFLDEHDWERVTNTLTCTSKHTFSNETNPLASTSTCSSVLFLNPHSIVRQLTLIYHEFRFETESLKELKLMQLSSIYHYKLYFIIGCIRALFLSRPSDESLVRAEAHPIYCGYFKMQQLGSLSRDRLAEIATDKGLDSAILDRPDEMLPLSPTHSSHKVGVNVMTWHDFFI